MSTSELESALNALKEGRFVLVYDADGREEECDFFLAAEYCTPEAIRTMRKEGGGLVFLMVRPDIRDRLALPFLQEAFPEFKEKYPIFGALVSDDIPYDTRSSFSVAINHRDTFTGVTDIDRSLTVKSFGELSLKVPQMTEAESMAEFGEHFRSPGHIPLCIGSDRILETRFGHTELSCALSTIAGLSGVTVGCEIMGDNGKSMPREEVMEYARRNNIPFLVGQQIIDAWKGWNGDWKKEYRPKPHSDISPHKLGGGGIPDGSSIPVKKGRRVMASGVFDLMHPGHLHFLQKARDLGDELIVVIARDSTVQATKRHPIVNERARRELVGALQMVDAAVLGYESAEIFRIIKELRPDVIALGHDQAIDEMELEQELSRQGLDMEVVRLDRKAGDVQATSELLDRIKKEPCE
ncbi:MAG: 3,4-dihydroxy-2-butanone-4-phosphate synthase [Candidatus Thermoplasmatota archaeon]|nr:3,4-dihydroxy-2-butanone-4-phosphate synthase [Candidatus Thermoplasmatota archaeon]